MEETMFEVTEKATEVIKQTFESREIPPIRIETSHSWGGPSLGMVPSEPHDDDMTFADKGITFLVGKELFDRVKPIRVDFVESPMGSGFQISSNLANASGSSCS